MTVVASYSGTTRCVSNITCGLTGISSGLFSFTFEPVFLQVYRETVIIVINIIRIIKHPFLTVFSCYAVANS